MTTIYETANIANPIAAISEAQRRIANALKRMQASRNAMPTQVERPPLPAKPEPWLQIGEHEYGVAIDGLWDSWSVATLLLAGGSRGSVERHFLELQPSELVAVSRHVLTVTADIERMAEAYVAACNTAVATAMEQASDDLAVLREWSEQQEHRQVIADLQARIAALEDPDSE